MQNMINNQILNFKGYANNIKFTSNYSLKLPGKQVIFWSINFQSPVSWNFQSKIKFPLSVTTGPCIGHRKISQKMINKIQSLDKNKSSNNNNKQNIQVSYIIDFWKITSIYSLNFIGHLDGKVIFIKWEMLNHFQISIIKFK